jgi:hypothetical protein
VKKKLILERLMNMR